MKSPPVRFLAISENGFEIFSFVETLGKRRLIQAHRLCVTFEQSRIQAAPFTEEPIVHRPISTLGSGAAGRDCRINPDPLVRSRIVPVDKPHFTCIDIFGLQARPGLQKELRTVPAGKVRILEQGNRSVGSSSGSSVLCHHSSAGLGQLSEGQQQCTGNRVEPTWTYHDVREVRFAFMRSSNPTIRSGQTTVASLIISAKRPPASGGTNFPHERPS